MLFCERLVMSIKTFELVSLNRFYPYFLFCKSKHGYADKG